MEKAPEFGSGDCKFESCHGRISKFITSCFHVNIQESYTLGARRTTFCYCTNRTKLKNVIPVPVLFCFVPVSFVLFCPCTCSGWSLTHAHGEFDL